LYLGRNGDQEYIRLSQQIVSSIQKISNQVSSIQKFTGHLGTQKDTEDLRERL